MFAGGGGGFQRRIVPSVGSEARLGPAPRGAAGEERDDSVAEERAARHHRKDPAQFTSVDHIHRFLSQRCHPNRQGLLPFLSHFLLLLLLFLLLFFLLVFLLLILQ